MNLAFQNQKEFKTITQLSFSTLTLKSSWKSLVDKTSDIAHHSNSNGATSFSQMKFSRMKFFIQHLPKFVIPKKVKLSPTGL